MGFNGDSGYGSNGTSTSNGGSAIGGDVLVTNTNPFLLRVLVKKF